MVKMMLTDNQRSKEDYSDDSLFYAQPRFSHHLDEKFRLRLTDLYRQKICEGSVVLDLMSSWVSHLPTDLRFKRVIGSKEKYNYCKFRSFCYGMQKTRIK